MFRTVPVAESAPDVKVPTDDLIPISVIALDLPEPPVGWVAYLNAKGVEVVTDDLGRASVGRTDARQLFVEHRAAEAVKAEKRAAAEQAAVEQDRQRRAQIWHGVPAGLLPDGLAPAEAMMLAGESSAPRAKSVREQLLEYELGSGESMVFHSFGPDEEA